MTLSLLKRQSPYTDDSPSQDSLGLLHVEHHQNFLSTNNYALIINGKKRKVPIVVSE